MQELKFKTNINCNGCVSKVSPELNAVIGIEKWNVDIENPQKILTVNTDKATAKDITQAVKKAGYNIESL